MSRGNGCGGRCSGRRRGCRRRGIDAVRSVRVIQHAVLATTLFGVSGCGLWALAFSGRFYHPTAEDRAKDTASTLLSRGDYQAAAEAYAAITKAGPHDGPSWYYQGFALHKLGRLDEALLADLKAAASPWCKGEWFEWAAWYNAGCAYA